MHTQFHRGSRDIFVRSINLKDFNDSALSAAEICQNCEIKINANVNKFNSAVEFTQQKYIYYIHLHQTPALMHSHLRVS